MDMDMIGQFRNAAINLSDSSSDATWQRVRDLFDALYAARFERLDVDKAWDRGATVPYFDSAKSAALDWRLVDGERNAE